MPNIPKEIISEINQLESPVIHQNLGTYGDIYVTIEKGKNQRKRDREKAAALRKAYELD